ncbi:MAG: hypothetical protein ABIH83_04630 [Candidatus Micrarchaeota archaeon]
MEASISIDKMKRAIEISWKIFASGKFFTRKGNTAEMRNSNEKGQKRTAINCQPEMLSGEKRANDASKIPI